MLKSVNIVGVFGLSLLLSSCGEFNKVVKSRDYEFKYKKAIEYYQAKEYSHASTLLTELIPIYRGTSLADDLYYYQARSFFAMGDYLMAGQWFRTLVREFPKSEFGEESQYMIGYCFYKESPKPRLDQQVTQRAIDALQLYVNLYPESERLEEANRLISELRDKLVYKSFLTGKLYYDLGNYRAATVALTNSLKSFPDTKYREDLSFMLLDAKYNLAVYSTEDKKELRLNDALDEYYSFVDEFPASKYRRQAEKYHDATTKLLNYEE